MTAELAPPDLATARAFARSWNTAGPGSVYSREQFLEWFEPLDPASFTGKDVLEMGFGNGSLLYHFGSFGPRRLCGVELGPTQETTRENLRHLPPGMVELHQGDLTEVELGQFDLVYCIGVLHHLSDPEKGFSAMLRHARPGARLHAWVYAREGNGLVRAIVEPIRRIACRLPWWLTKYALALPLVAPYYVYAKTLRRVAARRGRFALLSRALPLFDYSLWIAQRPFRFFHHVAFDQLVSPRTRFLRRAEIESWLSRPEIDPGSAYIVFRNGNSWKFGCRKR